VSSYNNIPTFEDKQTQKWTTSDYYGETDWLTQQHQFVQFENPKVTGDLAITCVKVPNNQHEARSYNMYQLLKINKAKNGLLVITMVKQIDWHSNICL